MSSSRPHGPRGPRSVIAVSITVVVGVVAMLAGTFFPWLASGTEQRNIYGAAGVVQRIAELGQPIGFLLDAVPLVGFYVVLCGALWVLGRRVVAALAVGLVSVLLAVIAAEALVHRSSGTARIVALGPMITLAGAGITTLSLLLLLVLGRFSAATNRDVIINHISSSNTSNTSSSNGTGSPESGPPARSSHMELT